MGSVKDHCAKNETIMLVTTNTKLRKPVFENPAFAREAIETLYRVQQLHPFFLFGFVIMPDHCHLLLSVPPPQSISTIIKQFKAGVSHNLGIGSVWQERFHIRTPQKAGMALKYMHGNPVHAGFVQSAEDYPWSSASGSWDITNLECW